MKVSQFFKETATYGFGEVLNKFFGFLLIPLFTRCLTPEDYGINSILMMIITILQPITLMGLGSSSTLCYFGENDREGKSEIIWTCFATLLISTAVPLAALGCCAPSLSTLFFKSPQFSSLIFLTLLTCLLTNITSPFIWVLKFENRATRFVILSALSVVTTLSLNLIFVVLLGKGIYGWVAAGTVSAFISLGLFIVGSLADIPKVSFSLTRCKELIRLGAPMILSLAFVVIMQHSNRYLLSELKGLEDLGRFTVGYNFGMILNLIVTAVCSAWPPFFMRFSDHPESGAKNFSQIFTLYTAFLGSLAFALFLFAKPVVALMTPFEFHEASSAVGPAALSSFFFGLFHLFLPGVYYAKKIYLTLIPQAFSACFCIAAGWWLIPVWGVTGAAVALMLANSVLCIAQFSLNVIGGFFQPAYDWTFAGGMTALFIVSLALHTLWSPYAATAAYIAGIWLLTRKKTPAFVRQQTA